MNELLIVIHFGFKDHGHLLMSFFSRKKLLFVGGSLAAGSRQQAAGSRQQAAGSSATSLPETSSGQAGSCFNWALGTKH